MENQQNQILLSSIKPGVSVEIVGFAQEDFPLKLLEMGLLPGNTVKVKRIAPLNDPMHIEVSGYDLALRINEANLILVKEQFADNTIAG